MPSVTVPVAALPVDAILAESMGNWQQPEDIVNRRTSGDKHDLVRMIVAPSGGEE